MLLAVARLAKAGYGDRELGDDLQLYPSYEERVLHHAVNMARVGTFSLLCCDACGASICDWRFERTPF